MQIKDFSFYVTVPDPINFINYVFFMISSKTFIFVSVSAPAYFLGIIIIIVENVHFTLLKDPLPKSFQYGTLQG